MAAMRIFGALSLLCPSIALQIELMSSNKEAYAAIVGSSSNLPLLLSCFTPVTGVSKCLRRHLCRG